MECESWVTHSVIRKNHRPAMCGPVLFRSMVISAVGAFLILPFIKRQICHLAYDSALEAQAHGNDVGLSPHTP